MTASPRRWIALGSAALVVVLAAGAAAAGEEPAKVQAAAAEPPWLLLAGIAVVGTLAVGGAAMLWARMLERLGPALNRTTSARSR